MGNFCTSDIGVRRKFYFMTTFWGESYREQFYSLLLPTLLAPNNIPILKSRPGSKLIVCTTKEDWADLKDRKLIHELAKYVELLPLFIGYPDKNFPIMLHMSKGHQLAAARASSDGAVAGFLSPDTLCSDGLIKAAVEMIESGKKAVVCPALRFSQEKVLKRILAAGYLKENQIAVLPASLMGSIAVNSLHPEILRYDFEGVEFSYYPLWVFWRVPDREGIIIYTVSWALLLGDYAAIPPHTDETLKTDTIDGFYVCENFGHLQGSKEVGILADSSQGMLISTTPEKQFSLGPSERRLNQIANYLSLANLKRFHDISKVHHSAALDSWRRWLFTQPIVLHGDEIDSRYTDYIERTTALIRDAIRFRTGSKDDTGLQTGKLFLMRLFILYYLIFCRVIIFRSKHLTRRILHILTFGKIYYPGSRGKNLRSVLLRVYQFTILSWLK